MLVLLSFYATVIMLFIVFRNRPVMTLLELVGLLYIIIKTRDIHIFLSMRQPQMLEDKYITLRYFDDEGKFCIFMISLPIFIIAMTAGLSVIVNMLRQIIKGSRELKKKQQEDAEKTEDEQKKDEKKNE